MKHNLHKMMAMFIASIFAVGAFAADVDVTSKVGTSKEAWNASGGPVTIDGISLPEKYETTTATLGDVMWQTVTGLENGKYTVELWANARYTSGRGFDSDAANGALDFTYLYANNVEISIEVYHNGDLNSGKSYKLEGVEVTDGTLKMGMTKKAAGSNWHTIQIKSLIYHASDDAALAIAKADLQAALNAANAVDPKKDDFVAAIATAQGVYDNSTSIEEVNATVVSLKEATKLAILGNASEENPVLTDFVVNGTFDSSKDPWKSTTGASNQTLASNKQGAFTGNFFENWNSSNYTGKLYQVIENIPNGVYELSICAFVETFDGSAQFVYANADKVALTTGDPTAYKVRTIVKNNTIEVGFEQTAAVNRWCGIDNVSLTYFGEASNEEVLNAAKAAFTAAYEEFGAALTACQAMMLKMSFYEIDDAAYQLNEQLETTTDVDALNAMVESLAEATASLNEINEVYAEYDVFVQKFKDAAENSEPLTTEAAELLEYNMYGGAGMQATSIEALEQATQTIKADFITYVANAKLLDGNMFDVTCLITNAAVTSAEGWTNAEGRIINNTEYTGAPDKAAFDAGWWAGAIDIHQVLPTLPAGNYVLSAVARSASPDSYLYAKSGETEVKATLPQNGNQGGELGNGWANVSTETINVVEGESLTIGVYINNPGENFAAADNFKLYYGGYLEDPAAAVLAQKKEAFLARAEEFRTFMDNNVDWSLQMINQTYLFPVSDEVLGDEGYGIVGLVDKMDEVTDIETLEYWMAEMDKVEALLAEANAAAAEFAKWQGLIQHAAGFAATYDEATVEAAMMYIEFSVGYNCATVEAINEATVGAEEAYKNFVLGATPVEGEKFDVTFLIQNPNFEKNMDGWTCVKAQYNGGEGYNGVGGIAEIAEWGATSWDASMSQTLTELPNGKYVVKASWMAAPGIEMTFAANAGEATVTGIGDTGGNIAKDGSVVEMGQGHRGWQYVEVECEVVDGTLAIVVSSSATVEHMWSNADAFELYYAGKDGGLVDGIKSVKSETNAVIYDLQGRRVQKMEKGLYIVNGKKVLVK